MFVTLTTTSALLEQLLQPDNDKVWREFDARYRPILVGLAHKLGLSAVDAEDAAQEALIRFVSNYRKGGYKRERGRLRGWMVAIARNCIMDLHRARAGRREHRGQSAFADLPGEDVLQSLWDAECRETIVRRALAELRSGTRLNERSVKAFELVAISQRPPQEVATELGISIDSVYTARNRCTRQLREIVVRLNEAYEISQFQV